MATDGDRPVRFTSPYEHETTVPILEIPQNLPIVFNTSEGPVRLLRGAEGQRAHQSIDQVLELTKLCAERNWPPPHTIVLSQCGYDYLTGLLNAPRKKDEG